MVELEQQIKAADNLADVVDKLLREKCSLVELTAALLEYRSAQIIVDEELSQAFDNLQKQMSPVLDYEEKNVYRNLSNKAYDSKKRS
jgi:uncharacterized membrane protein YccC